MIGAWWLLGACATTQPPAPSPPPTPPATVATERASLALAAALAWGHREAELAHAVGEASRELGQALRSSRPRPAWRCSADVLAEVNDPDHPDDLKALSDHEALAEWRASPMVRHASRRGLVYYQYLRWLYRRRGVCDVPGFFRDGIVVTRFLGLWLQVHLGMAERLERVEARLREQGHRVRIGRIGGFVPRTLRGPYGSLPWLSNHAFGLAVDIDPHLNPYLSINDLVALEHVSGVSIERSARLDAGARWDRFALAQRQFKANVHGWLRDNAATILGLRGRVRAGDAEAAAELERLERLRALVTGSRHLRAAVRGSFLALPRALVVAMEQAGLTWCTDFPNGADLMHFEIRERW